MKLYLIRHGETEYNDQQRFQGYAEIPLNDVGIRQAMLLARSMSDVELDVVYSSDIRRTVMTATVLSAVTGAPIVYEERYRERNPGELVHKPYEEGMGFFNDPAYVPPAGESLSIFDGRITAAFDHLLSVEGDRARNVAVITHGMVCSSFYQHALGHTLEERAAMHWPNTALSILDYEGAWRVQTLADVSHLKEREAPKSRHATGA